MDRDLSGVLLRTCSSPTWRRPCPGKLYPVLASAAPTGIGTAERPG